MNLPRLKSLSPAEKGSHYQELCACAKINPVKDKFDLLSYSDVAHLGNSTNSERLTAALSIFLEYVLSCEDTVEKVDRVTIDYFISKIDHILHGVVDEILHQPAFQELESIWRSLEYLIAQVDLDANIKVEIMDVSKEVLAEDFDSAQDITQSGLYKHLYEREYDTPGGEPFSAIISNYFFNHTARDIQLLKNIAAVSANIHCPFIASVTPHFFGKENFEQVSEIENLERYFDRSEYINWNQFRQSEEARYIGLTFPRFLLRLPYGRNSPVRLFNYEEQVYEGIDQYLWGSASFALGANLAKSFKKYGWAIQIRGIESGGKVEGLLLHQYDLGHGFLTKIPTEIVIPESRELEFSHLGFIPLSYYKNTDFACFFSANSIQKAKQYLSKEATANCRINARLPYIFLSCRIAHYLKVLQRENIGSNITQSELETRLNEWLKTLITCMPNPDPEQIAKYPLRDASVEVHAIPEDPGFYRVILYLVPHFQVEGLNVNLSVVGKIPTGKQK